MEKFARDRELAPDRAERTDTLVWGKNAVTELLKSGGAVDTVVEAQVCAAETLLVGQVPDTYLELPGGL